MPDSLDVAKQRKLIEDLKRDGLHTQDAEMRLRDMLELIRGAQAYRLRKSDRPRRETAQTSR